MNQNDISNKHLEVLNFLKEEKNKKSLLPTKKRNYNYWTLNEDEKLMRLARELKYDWVKISLEFIERTSEEVEKRWKLRVDPTTKKTPWTKEEDSKILYLHRKLGGNWKLIATHLTGRLPSTIKNRFYSKLQKIESNNKDLNRVSLLDDDLSTMPDLADAGLLKPKAVCADSLKMISNE